MWMRAKYLCTPTIIIFSRQVTHTGPPLFINFWGVSVTGRFVSPVSRVSVVPSPRNIPSFLVVFALGVMERFETLSRLAK